MQVEMGVVAALAGRDVGEQPHQHARERLVDFLGLAAPLKTNGVTIRCHHMPRHSPLNSVPTTALGTISRNIPIPSRAPAHCPPGSLVGEIEEEQGGRHLVRRRQPQQQPGGDVISLAARRRYMATIRNRINKLLLP